MGVNGVGSVPRVVGIGMAGAVVLVLALGFASGLAAAETAPVNGTITDEEGMGLDNVTVSVGDQETVTDDDGSFEFEPGLGQLGIATLAASRAGYESKGVQLRRNDPETLEVSLNLSIDEDAPMYQNGTLRGTISDDSNDPVEGATVRLVAEHVEAPFVDDDPFVLTDRTDADGEYEFETWPGEYELVASAEGYADVSSDQTVTPNRLRITGLSFSEPRAPVVGSVTDADGTPLANATVADINADPETGTNETGAFTLRTLPGERWIVADADGYHSTSEQFDVGGEEVAEHTFVLERNESATDGESDDVESGDGESDEDPDGETGGEPIDIGSSDDADAADPSTEATSLPGYWESMSMLGVFASALLVLATIAFVRQ